MKIRLMGSIGEIEEIKKALQDVLDVTWSRPYKCRGSEDVRVYTVLFDRRFDAAWHTSWREASLVNHIWPDDVKGLPKIDEYVVGLAKIIGSAGTIIGYNLPFDLDFLVNYGITPHKEAKKYDVMRDFARYYGEWADWADDYKWKKLTLAADYVGYDWDRPAHGALSDCYATLAVYNYLEEERER